MGGNGSSGYGSRPPDFVFPVENIVSNYGEMFWLELGRDFLSELELLLELYIDDESIIVSNVQIASHIDFRMASHVIPKLPRLPAPAKKFQLLCNFHLQSVNNINYIMYTHFTKTH